MSIGLGGHGAAQASLTSALAALVPLALPDEGGGVGIPAGDGVVEPGDQLVLRRGMVALKGTPDEDPLDRLSEPMLLHLL